MSYEHYRHVFETCLLFCEVINNIIIDNIECITFSVLYALIHPMCSRLKDNVPFLFI